MLHHRQRSLNNNSNSGIGHQRESRTAPKKFPKRTTAGPASCSSSASSAAANSNFSR